MKKVKVYLVKVLHYSRPIQRNNSTVISVRDIFTLDEKDVCCTIGVLYASKMFFGSIIISTTIMLFYDL